MARNSILVSGLFGRSISADDFFMHFQSRRMSGGGDVDNVILLGQGKATVIFEDEKVAQRVLRNHQHQHYIKGYLVKVSVPQEPTGAAKSSSEESSDEDEDLDECACVEVKGLSSNTTKDSLQNYFENTRKSKGGPVSEVFLQRGLNMAIVKFRSQNDAKNVTEYHKHKLDGCRLAVSLLYPEPKHDLPNERNDGQSPGGQPDGPLQFVISGISSNTTEDSVRNYLENVKRSGGGEVQTLTFDPEEGVAEVKFDSVKDIDHLLQKAHTLDGAALKVLIKEPEKEIPVDPLKLHVKGLNKEKTTRDGLKYYMEKMCDAEVTRVDFGTYGNAMITFAAAPDFAILSQKIRNDHRGLEGINPLVERIPICCCIIVKSLPDNSTVDSISLYFEHPRRGAGVDVTKVEHDERARTALVYFDHPSAIERILGKEHELSNVRMNVTPYYPFLCEEQGVQSKRNHKGKAEIEVDPELMTYITMNHKDELDTVLQEYGVNMKWTQEENVAKIESTESGSGNREVLSKRVSALQGFLATFKMTSIGIEPQLWEVVTANLDDVLRRLNIHNVQINFISSECKIVVIGKQRYLGDVTREVEKTVKKIEEDQEMKDSVETHIEEDMDPGKLTLLQLSGHCKRLEMSSEHVKIEIDASKGKLLLQGPKNLLQDLNIDIFKFFTKAKEEVLELPERVLKVLQSRRGEDVVQTLLKQNEIEAVLVFNERERKNEAAVVGVSREHAKKAASLVQLNAKEKSIHIEQENIEVLNNNIWKKFVSDLESKKLIDIVFERSSNTLWLSGIDPDTTECLEIVKEYLNTNTILTNVLDVQDGCARFLFRVWNNKVEKIQKDLTRFSISIKPSTECEGIEVSGTREGMEMCMKELTSLTEEVCEEDVKVDKPGMRKFLRQSQGRGLIKVIEDQNKCAVEVHVSTADQQEGGLGTEAASRGPSEIAQFICSYTTSEGKKLTVYKGDLTKHQTDIIVNAANGDLQHVGGLAGAILKEGGRKIQDECDIFIQERGSLLEGQVMVSNAGKLPCKRIIHAVGPRWDTEAGVHHRNGKPTKQGGILKYAFMNCLKEGKDYHSIAIPAVSSGIFGVPLELCARVLVDAVLEFIQESPRCTLSEIHFVNNDDPTANAIAAEMRQRFGAKSSFRDRNTSLAKKGGRPRGLALKRSPQRSSARTTGDGNLKTPEGITIKVKAGDLAKEQAGVLVNTVGNDLNLRNNACARSLSTVAGPRLQEYCNAIAPVQVGDIGVTQPGKLRCDFVFHAVCADWSGGKGEKVLRSILKESLKKATTNNATSIAIPAIGTGVLQFPRDVVARVSFEEAIVFSRKNPGTTLKVITFVVYDKDQPTVHAFRSELASRTGSTRGNFDRDVSTLEDIYEDTAATETTSSFTPIRERTGGCFEVNTGPIAVHVQSGDITKETTDGIVVISNTELDLTLGGGAGAAILKAGGRGTIRRECAKRSPVASGGIVLTTAGTLSARKLIHYVPSSSSMNQGDLETSVLKCLEAAETNGLSSLSFPAMGTGNLGVPPKTCAKAMLLAAQEFARRRPTSLKLMRITVYQEPMMKDFQSAMRELTGEGPEKNENPGMFRRLTNYVGLTSDKRERKVVEEDDGSSSEDIFLVVFSGSKASLQAAVKAIKDMMSANCKKQVINNESIRELRDEEMRAIHALELRYDINVVVEKRVTRIIIEGSNEDILAVVTAIHEILDKVKEIAYESSKAEILAKGVQWEYYDQDGYIEYSKETNGKIEVAYCEKKKTVTFEEDEVKCKLTFATMTEEEVSGHGEIRKVKRKDLRKDIRLPGFWDVQPTDSAGKEKTVHLVDLDPNQNAQEYLKVTDTFRKTCSSTILKIQRVQNPVQFKIYAMKKQEMDDGKGSNERMLFHGTPTLSCESINRTGFNRSYCGKNAAVYGNGVYFAVNAEYSARSTYSPADGNGHRYMYFARVLTGEYIQGGSGVLTAPPKDPSKPFDTYDTVVDQISNPEIFVSFHDWQCYPEYLIVFQ